VSSKRDMAEGIRSASRARSGCVPGWHRESRVTRQPSVPVFQR